MIVWIVTMDNLCTVCYDHVGVLQILNAVFSYPKSISACFPMLGYVGIWCLSRELRN